MSRGDWVLVIVAIVLALLWCAWYLTKGSRYEGDHERTAPGPDVTGPDVTGLESTTLLEDRPSSLPDDDDLFADEDDEHDPDRSLWLDSLRADPDAPWPPLPVEAHHEPVTLAVPPVLPMVPVLPVLGLTGRPVPPGSGGDDEGERRYRAAVEALVACMPADEVQPDPEPLPQMPCREMSVMPARAATGMEMPRWAGPAMTDQATGTRMPLEADRMADVLGKLRAWTPQPAVPQESEPAPEPVTEDQPVTAGDETREIWLGMARQMNWLTPAEQVALWDQKFCKPIVVGAPQHAAEDGAQ